MASISYVNLRIIDGMPVPGEALIQVKYTLTASHHDAPCGQAYREVVELVGDDSSLGEDGQSDVIPGGTLFDGTVVFSNFSLAFTQIREKTLPSAILDADPGPIIRTDVIRARVTLTPIPQASPSRESNLVRRGQRVLING